MILMVVYVVAMMFWLFSGCYVGYDATKPHMLVGNTLIPWACVAILGWKMFGG